MFGKLTHYKLCPRSRSIRLALSELGFDVLLADENPWEWRPGFLARNPSGELPILDLENGLTVCGAYAISEYIGEEVGSGATSAPSRRIELFPGHSEDRTEVRRLIDWFHGKFDREVSRDLLNEKVYQALRPEAAAPDIDVLRAVRANLRYHLSYISFLADTRRWLAGEALSFADLAAAGQVSVVDYLGEVPWNEFPPAKAWYQRIKSRPSFRSLLADRVPGASPAQTYADLDF